MKKVVQTSILFVFAASAALAATTVDITVVGGSGDFSTRVPIPKDNKNYNVILDGPAATKEGTMFSGNGATIAALDGATNTPGTVSDAGKTPAWNFAGNLTIDINSAEAGGITALTTGNNKFAWNLGTLTIKNSQSNDSTYANVDLGAQFRMTVNYPASQASNLVIATNANLSGQSLAFAANSGGGVFFEKGVKANYTVSQTHIAGNAFFSIGENAVVDASSKELGFNFYSGSTLQIAAGGTFKTQKVNTNTGWNAEINGNFEYVGKNQLTLANASISGGKFVATELTNGTSARTLIRGGMSVSNGGTIDQKGGLELKGASSESLASLSVDSSAGYIKLYDNVGEDGQNYQGRLFLSGNTQLVINKANAFTRVLANGATGDTTLMMSAANNSVIVNEKTRFGNFYYWNGATELTIELSDTNADAKLYIGGISGASGNTLTIENFADDMICFWTNDEAKTIGKYDTITANTADGTTYGKGDLTLVKGTLDGKDVYFLNRINVPEPAEWAAIFGAIALGLAVYRRRK